MGSFKVTGDKIKIAKWAMMLIGGYLGFELSWRGAPLNSFAGLRHPDY